LLVSNSSLTFTLRQISYPSGNTHLLFLHVEVFNDDADEEVECKKGTEDDEEDEV